MTYSYIRFDEAKGVATMTLARPAALNALTTAMIEEMIDAVDRVRDSGTIRCLLLTGAGRAFCSGADLATGGTAGSTTEGASDTGHRLETHFNPLIERLFALPVPFVTAVTGAAAGAGASLALAGDIVIAGESAYFLQAFVNIGLVPDVGATWLLPRLAGRARALAMMMLGERVPAATALEWGMIWQVVPDAELMAVAQIMAARLAAGPTQTYGLIRSGIRAAMDCSLTNALAVERRNQRLAGQTTDFAEGVSAFLQKRPAAFTGK